MRLVCIVALCLVSVPAWAEFDVDETLFRDAKLGVKLPLPEGWTPSTQTGYPSLHLLLFAPDGKSSISLAAGTLAAGQSLRDYVLDSRQSLQRVGVHVTSTAQTSLGSRPIWEIAGQGGKKPVELRQLYLAQGNRIFILTLACSADRLSQSLLDFTETARALQVE
jgi:hypothetical protein